MEGMEFYTEYCALTNLIKDGETCFERTLEEIVDGMAKVPVNTKSLLSYFPFIHYYITSQDLLTTGEWPHSAYEDEYIVETSWRTAEDSLREQGYRYITFRRESSISSDSSSKSSTIIAREDGGRVYVKKDDYMDLLANDSYWSQLGDASYIPYNETENGELVLYDFTMEPGDSFRHVDGHDDIVVDSVGTLTTLDGVERRLIYLSNGCQVAEGLGCLNSIGALFFYLNPLRSDYQRGFLSTFAPTYSSMVGYYNKYIYYYTLQEERETILAGIESVARAECSTSESLLFFDLQGRHLAITPEDGDTDTCVEKIAFHNSSSILLTVLALRMSLTISSALRSSFHAPTKRSAQPVSVFTFFAGTSILTYFRSFVIADSLSSNGLISRSSSARNSIAVIIVMFLFSLQRYKEFLNKRIKRIK